MKKSNDKKMVLLATSLVGVFSLGSTAVACNEPKTIKSLVPLEMLPPVERSTIRGRINNFLSQNPTFDLTKSIFAVDKNGDVYVLDKNKTMGFDLDDVPAPSTIN